MISEKDAELFERCMSVGGVAVFPADTVYGLACEADDKEAVRRLYALKGRPQDKPAAVMFFDLSLALESVPEAGPRTVEAMGRLLPGPVTLLVPNPAGRFPIACSDDPHTLGLRVPMLEGGLAALSDVRWPVLQSSANVAGGPEACTLDEVPLDIRQGCDLVLDGGRLGGVASTVVDLRGYEQGGEPVVLREGALSRQAVAERLA